MKKLEVEMYRYRNMLFGRVVHMNDDLREELSVSDEAGFSLKSETFPDMGINTFYVRGEDRDCDNDVFSLLHDTEEEAIKAAEHFKRLIDKVNDEDKLEDNVVRVI